MTVKSYEEMQELLKLQEGENFTDVLSLYDAQNRYKVSRNLFREAAILGKIKHEWLGGITKKNLYMKRKDIIAYLSLSQKRSKSKIVVPWRMQDKKIKTSALLAEET